MEKKIALDNYFLNFLYECEITNCFCIQKIRVGHRANFQGLFPVFSILLHFYFRSRVLSNAAGVRAHPREERSSTETRTFPKMDFASFCEVVFVIISRR